MTNDSPVTDFNRGVHEGLMAAAKAATDVSRELRGANDHDKQLGQYGANAVWHRIFDIDPMSIKDPTK